MGPRATLTIGLLAALGSGLLAGTAGAAPDPVRWTAVDRYRTVLPIIRGEQSMAEVASQSGLTEDEVQRWFSAAVLTGRSGLISPAAADIFEFVEWISGTWRLQSRTSGGSPTDTSTLMKVDVGFGGALPSTAVGTILIIESGTAHSFVSELGDDGPFSMGAFMDVVATITGNGTPVVQFDFTGDAVGSYGSFVNGESFSMSADYEKIGAEYVMVTQIVSSDGAGGTDTWDVSTVSETTQVQSSSQLDIVDSYVKVNNTPTICGVSASDYWAALQNEDFVSLKSANCLVSNPCGCAASLVPSISMRGLVFLAFALVAVTGFAAFSRRLRVRRA